MDQEQPTWIDSGYLSAALQGGEENEPRVTIVDYDVKPAVPPGNNYHSTIYRVMVRYRVEGSNHQESTSLIVKSPIEGGLFAILIQKGNLFSKERRMYTEFLPHIDELLNTQFAPKSFYCPSIRNDVVLKDLKDEGYVTCDKFNKLNYQHCKVVLNTIAKFHGSSVSFYNENPTFIKTIGEEKLNMEKDTALLVQYCIKNVARVMSELEGCNGFAEIILKKADHLWESAKTLCKQSQKGFNVLNHGDLWQNNVLFKYDKSGNIVDAKLIDFQVPKYASPVFDLLYFMWTSATEEVLEGRQQELYDHYLQTLNTTLERLGCQERLTAEELREDLKAASDYVLIVICFLLPHMMCAPEDFEKIDSAAVSSDKSEKSDKMFHSKHFKALMPTFMRQYTEWVRDLS